MNGTSGFLGDFLRCTVSFSHIVSHPQKSSNIFTVRGSLVFIVCLLLIGTSAGCSFFTPPASKEKLDLTESHWFHYDAAQRGGFLVLTDDKGNTKMKMCAEPAPDVALAKTAEFIAKGAYQGATAEAQAKLSEQLVQLGGRTETVLILRESLFRLCELSISSNLSSKDVQTLYTVVVNVVGDLLRADLANAQANATKADTELKKAETERMRIFNSLSPNIQRQFAP